MADADKSKLKLKMILTALETDTQTLADQIGEQRPVISDIINGKPRKAITARRNLTAELCRQMSDLILPAEQPEAEKVT